MVQKGRPAESAGKNCSVHKIDPYGKARSPHQHWVLRKDNGYDIVIDRGKDPINDAIFDFLKPRIKGRWLDVGCNAGALLMEVSNGKGVDASQIVVGLAKERGLDVQFAYAEKLPFSSNQFKTVVLSCVLEQCKFPNLAIAAALNVCKTGGHVIGINPFPDKSVWGKVGGTQWVKSVISPEQIKSDWHARIEEIPQIPHKYYFSIRKK